MTTVYKQEASKALVLGFFSLIASLVLIKQGEVKKAQRPQQPPMASKKIDGRVPSVITMILQSDDQRSNVMRICKVVKEAQYIAPLRMDITTIGSRKNSDNIEAQEETFLKKVTTYINALYPDKPEMPIVIYVNRLYIFIVH